MRQIFESLTLGGSIAAIAVLMFSGAALADTPAPAKADTAAGKLPADEDEVLRAPDGCAWKKLGGASDAKGASAMRLGMECRRDAKTSYTPVAVFPAGFDARTTNQALAGDAHAQVLLARFYTTATPARNPAKARALFEAAAKAGDTDGMTELGSDLQFGLFGPADQKRAFALFRQAAEKGDSGGKLMLGESFYYGRGTPVDKVQAAKWYGDAAEQGNALAVFRLGAVRMAGEGVARDDVEGGKLVLKAARAGVPPAMDAAARLYASGRGGLVKDPDQSLLWVVRASSAGDPDGMEDMGMMFHTGADGLPVNELEAAHWFHAAAERGWPNAMYQLGMLYLEGRGVPVDQAQGIKWLKAAAAKGDPEAVTRLKAMGVQ